MQMSRCATFL